jgi:hypothetical protein
VAILISDESLFLLSTPIIHILHSRTTSKHWQDFVKSAFSQTHIVSFLIWLFLSRGWTHLRRIHFWRNWSQNSLLRLLLGSLNRWILDLWRIRILLSRRHWGRWGKKTWDYLFELGRSFVALNFIISSLFTPLLTHTLNLLQRGRSNICSITRLRGFWIDFFKEISEVFLHQDLSLFNLSTYTQMFWFRITPHSQILSYFWLDISIDIWIFPSLSLKLSCSLSNLVHWVDNQIVSRIIHSLRLLLWNLFMRNEMRTLIPLALALKNLWFNCLQYTLSYFISN